jgi:negative regulator of replication initiation
VDRVRDLAVDGEVRRLIERHRRSASESGNDILRRILPLVPAAPAPRASLAATASPPPPGTRRRGQWAVEIEGERIAAANLVSAYRTLLEALDRLHPDFLALFAEEKGRRRSFVAPTPAALYPASPHLAKRHAEPLAAGWWFDSNVSTVQVARRARIAARLCGLRYGAQLRILEGLREI